MSPVVAKAKFVKTVSSYKTNSYVFNMNGKDVDYKIFAVLSVEENDRHTGKYGVVIERWGKGEAVLTKRYFYIRGNSAFWSVAKAHGFNADDVALIASDPEIVLQMLEAAKNDEFERWRNNNEVGEGNADFLLG